MRRLLAILTICVGVIPATTVVASSPARAANTPCAIHTRDAASMATTVPTGHCTILSIGDSVGLDLGIGLAHELQGQQRLPVVSRGVVSTGLVHDSFYNWPAHLRTYLNQFRPDVVIVCVGANDHSSMLVNGKWAPFLTPLWQQGYLARITQIATMSSQAGAQVVWVGVPPSGSGGYRWQMELMNKLYQRAMTHVANALYVVPGSRWTFPNGKVRPMVRVNGQLVQVRALDLIHYSPLGEDVFACDVLRAISTTFNVALRPNYPASITD